MVALNLGHIIVEITTKTFTKENKEIAWAIITMNIDLELCYVVDDYQKNPKYLWVKLDELFGKASMERIDNFCKELAFIIF